MQKLHIGIDISKDTLDICLLTHNKIDFLKILNNEDSIKGFINYLRDNYKKTSYYFGYESTSNYSIKLKKELTNNEFKQIEINAYKMSLYLKHLNPRIKSDLKDCEGIARYLTTLKETNYITSYNDIETKQKKKITIIQHLEKLTIQLNNLIKSQKDIDTPFFDNAIKNLKDEIEKTKKQLKENAIKSMYKDDPLLKNVKDNIKGVGDILMLYICPYLTNIDKFNVKQFQCYLGLTPKTFESGTSIHKKQTISKQGNGLVRKILYMATLNAIRNNEIIKEKYNRLITNGKSKMVAVVACMCHLLRAIFYQYEKLSISK